MPETLATQFTGSVLDLLIHIGDPPLSSSKTEISAIHAPRDVAKALKFSAAIPCCCSKAFIQ
jgi:DNA-binding GntR family transcriptional regulator